MNHSGHIVLMVLTLAAARPGRALNSTEPWVFGSLPYETTPFKEVNLGYSAGFKGDAGLAGAGTEQRLQVQAGIWEHLAVTMEEGLDIQGSPKWFVQRALLQANFFESGSLPVDLGLLGGWMQPPCFWPDPARPEPQTVLGAVVAREISDQSLNINALVFSNHAPVFRAALRTSFLLTTLRAGLEGEWSGGDGDFYYAPQASLDFPGDLCFKGGCKLSPARPGTWTAFFQASIELFGGL